MSFWAGFCSTKSRVTKSHDREVVKLYFVFAEKEVFRHNGLNFIFRSLFRALNRHETERGHGGMNQKTILLGLTVFLSLVVLLQNTQVVTLRFLFWRTSMSQILVVLILFGLGFLAGYLTGKGVR